MSTEPTDLSWDQRLEGETEKAHAAFVIYRGLPQGQRSIDAVRKAQGRPCKRILETWSSRWHWVERVAAYDAHQQSIALAEAEEETRRLAVEHVRARVRLQRAFLERVFDRDRPVVDRLADLAHNEERTESGGAVISAGAQVSAIRALIDGANLKPVVGNDGSELDEDARRRIVEDGLAELLGVLPEYKALALLDLLEEAWRLLDARDAT